MNHQQQIQKLEEELVAIKDSKEKEQKEEVNDNEVEERPDIVQIRKEKRKAKKTAEKVKAPKSGQNIVYKEILLT